MKGFILAGVILFFSLTAEAAYIPSVPQCQVLANHTDVAECFGVLNATLKPDTTKCGQLDLPAIMRSVDANNSALAGSTWRRLGSLVLNQCGYSSQVKDMFLSLEKGLFGGPEPREKATSAWRRQVCIKADRDKYEETPLEGRAQDYLMFVGNTYFGGGPGGVKKADYHLRSLIVAENQAELDRLANEYLEHRIKPCL